MLYIKHIWQIVLWGNGEEVVEKCASGELGITCNMTNWTAGGTSQAIIQV